MVRDVEGRAEAAQFLDLPARLGPLGWGVALRFEQAMLFDRTRNGFLAEHTVARFLAWRDGVVVGRIAGCVPRDASATASFGFLCCEPDAAVVAALVGAARDWIAGHGRGTMQGPLSFSINHEVGAQIDTFGREPAQGWEKLRGVLRHDFQHVIRHRAATGTLVAVALLIPDEADPIHTDSQETTRAFPMIIA